MDLQTMRTEVQARGFSHVTNTFIDRWINLTYHDVNSRYPWPYLETSTSGATGTITVADLGHVLGVSDITDKIPLEWRDLRFLKEQDPGLVLTGNPRFWYRDGSANTIKTYPATTNTVEVRYIKVAADLGTDTSVPLSPANFHYLYVEGACARAYRRANEAAAAADCFGEVETGIHKMAQLLLPPEYTEPTPNKPSAPNSEEEAAPAQGA